MHAPWNALCTSLAFKVYKSGLPNPHLEQGRGEGVHGLPRLDDFTNTCTDTVSSICTLYYTVL